MNEYTRKTLTVLVSFSALLGFSAGCGAPPQEESFAEASEGVLLHCPPGEAPQCDVVRGRNVCTCQPLDLPTCSVSSTPPATLSIGGVAACAVSSDTGLRCWGTLPGSSTVAATATLLATGAASVSVGATHACFVTTGGLVECFGSNDHGELGDGTTTPRTTPAPVLGISNAIAVSAGGNTSCAVLASGAVSCWGDNGSGELGDGTVASRPSPSNVVGISDAVDVRVSRVNGGHVCARSHDGTVRCWGSNYSGELGNGTTSAMSTTPVVAQTTNAVDLGGGSAVSCSLDCYAQASCWGFCATGDCAGASSATAQSVPAAVPGASSIVQLSSEVSSCGRQFDGSVVCWGVNVYGEAGTGDTAAVTSPRLVAGVSNVTTVAMGEYGACARQSDGSVYCWGSTYSTAMQSLGDGTTSSHYTPVRVLGLP